MGVITMDERDMIKEFGQITAKIESLEKEIDDLRNRVRSLEVKIAYYTGIGTSVGVIVGITLEAIVQRLVGG